ncbi:trypsin-like peptidase domain-containing protein [Erythrobacter sp. SDW2]|uniref:S1C family serine protease n=1 Tax=Erythrobacter sp. SDW2 TaxID=2907154 RepID=UPI001F290842|nr:trypsin-like peptidase domain-containing protein [Erythrobacter sp. SDW2]UIP07954.1 trypsin-like peptidase domain-containing protein [Erythrobacter sp. SDW2]
MLTRLKPLAAALLALVLAALPQTAGADPADIQAAARGVVRVVIIGTDGSQVYPVSHGTGFAVSSTKIVTNAHVVREASMDDELRIGIVPSDGDDASYARVLAIDPKRDLALLEITGTLRLPPLTLAGARERDGAEVVSVGYPMNVDRAQGLEIGDIFKPQGTVNSTGFISGQRPAKQFDSILHTAPIARGNSGGPLLDQCGRVLGVNSFGAESDGTDAEFYFAVSNRELLPFLRDNGVTARVNTQPCRSLAELDAQEQARARAAQEEAQAALAARSEDQREKRTRAQMEAGMAVQADRENQMALAMVLLLVGAGAAYTLFQLRGQAEAERERMIAGTIAAVALIAALAAWFTRPGLDEIDRRVAEAMTEDRTGAPTGAATVAADARLTCTLVPERSRITGDPAEMVEFDWTAGGCVNGRTQYGFKSGEWSRVFVPNEEAAVSVARYDPETRTYRTDRYLLTASAMAEARKARGAYSTPTCQTDDAAAKLGDLQSAVTSVLPEQPNERLVYSCSVKN